MTSNHYQVAIVGGGITGAALFYELSRYTDIKSVCLLEKYEALATLNSSGWGNSQSIHFGDIETNYTIDKARVTKRTAKMVEKYCHQWNLENKVLFSHQKMAMAVGDKEVEFMTKRHEEIVELFPYMEMWDKRKLTQIEPMVVYDENGRERTDNIMAFGAQNQWTTVEFGKMAESMIEKAQERPDVTADVKFNSQVTHIEKLHGKYHIFSESGSYTADFVIVDAGAHSLYLAHKMGFGLDFACLPVAGSFYLTKKKILNGKVYMVQNPKLPFAALHGDPDLVADGNTRFGPTALVIPKLERFKGNGTILDFWDTLKLDMNVIKVFIDLMGDSDIRAFVARNLIYEIPFVGSKFFLEGARKIVPSLQLEDIEYAKGFGGVRPQVINKKEKRLMLGEASINSGDGIIFNMTPSPGATSCLGNAERDVKCICEHLGLHFNQDQFDSELLERD